MNLRHLGLSFLVLADAAVVYSGFACGAFAPLPARDPARNARNPQAVTLTDAVSFSDGPHNGLSPEALRHSQKLLTFLPTLPSLTTASFTTAASRGSADFKAALTELNAGWDPSCGTRRDSCASQTMEYIVSCALDATTPTVELDTSATPPLSWKGELGLCESKASSPVDHWPNPNCLKAVSACVLTRVNALDQRVAISLRGESVKVVPTLRANVPLETTLREKDGTEFIKSLNTDCTAADTIVDEKRDCGWARRYVGRCARGTKGIHLTLKSPTGSAMVRVCKGIHGCDHLADYKSNGYSYGGWVAASNSATVSFDCPQTTRTQSYFGVMVAAEDPLSGLPDVSVDVMPDTDAGAGARYVYPAKEEDVFTYREGAFYGDIFQPYEGNPPNALFGEQYACYSSIWSSGQTELAGRMCAGSATKCFSNDPYPCLNSTTPPPNSCGKDDGPGEGYRDCIGFKGPGHQRSPSMLPDTWPRALTVLLNDPCDLSPANDCLFSP